MYKRKIRGINPDIICYLKIASFAVNEKLFIFAISYENNHLLDYYSHL